MNQPATQGDQPVPHHGELIDLNQPNLEALRESLRATFPKEILSKGALAGIIEWRRQSGAFSSVEELREIRGIGPMLLNQLQSKVGIITPPDNELEQLEVPGHIEFERPKQLQIILGPHGNPYSDGDEIKLGVEVVTLIKGIVGRLCECDPITLWLENAFPSRFADALNVDEVQETLRRVADETGISYTECRTDLIEHGQLPQRVDSFLRWEHDHARQLDQALTQEELYEALSNSHFHDPLFWWIEEQYNNALHSPESARAVTLKSEVSTFESWLNLAASALALEQSETAYLEGDLDRALESLKEWGRFVRASSQKRDIALGQDIQSYQLSLNSKETVIVIRGSYHGPLLTEALLDQGIESDQMIYGEPINQNGSEFFTVKLEVAGAIELHRMLIESDLELVASESFIQVGSNLALTIHAAVSALTDAQIASWVSAVGKIPAPEDLIKAKSTFSWLLAQDVPGIEKLMEFFKR